LSLLDTQHEDLVHDLHFDFYGTRLVTASSDHKLKVWDLQPDKGTEGKRANGPNPNEIVSPTGGNWSLNEGWKAHEASIVRVMFAPPEFGQIVVSCSLDRTVRIWEEVEPDTSVSGAGPSANSTTNNTSAGMRRWHERARLVDSRASVTDIAFAPSHLGLKLVPSLLHIF
jgi:nucleoporin SEH1